MDDKQRDELSELEMAQEDLAKLRDFFKEKADLKRDILFTEEETSMIRTTCDRVRARLKTVTDELHKKGEK
jgi:hypothetical protein